MREWLVGKCPLEMEDSIEAGESLRNGTFPVAFSVSRTLRKEFATCPLRRKMPLSSA